jgi:hypothetical protein
MQPMEDDDDYFYCSLQNAWIFFTTYAQLEKRYQKLHLEDLRSSTCCWAKQTRAKTECSIGSKPRKQAQISVMWHVKVDQKRTDAEIDTWHFFLKVTLILL